MADNSTFNDNFGAIVIGRNEGQRLRTCLLSVTKFTSNIVYVDSGSTDGSVTMATTMGVVVLELDRSRPFTAARARNMGFRKLSELFPGISYVQFVDGDCEILDGWIESAVDFLESKNSVATVSGHLWERFPDRSVYNLLCDIEWNMQVGEINACGGNAIMRATAFEQAGGFNQSLIAGEEPDLCIRLRTRGWKIWKLDTGMALHDAAMTRFGQWWKRSVRAGFAFAEGASLHWKLPERFRVRETLSSLAWGLVIPTISLILIYFFQLWGAILLTIYPVQIIRLSRNGPRSPRDNWWWAFFLVLGKFPEMLGVLQFILQQFLSGEKELIEYK